MGIGEGTNSDPLSVGNYGDGTLNGAVGHEAKLKLQSRGS